MNEKLFSQSLTYIEGVQNKLLGERFSKHNFDQLNAFYISNGLEENIDLLPIYKKVEELTIHVTQNVVDEVEREASELVEEYLVHHTSIFLVDNFANASLSDALKHALTVYHVIHKKHLDNNLFNSYPILKSLLSKNKISNSIIDGWYFNNHFFTINHSIFKYLGVNFEIIKTTDKAFCIRAINFLEQVKSYKKGDRISKISSSWSPTRNGKKRWRGAFICTVVEGENGCSSHGFDWISEHEVIYQNAYGIGLSGGSETNLYKKEDIKDDWQKVKNLQKLIR